MKVSVNTDELRERCSELRAVCNDLNGNMNRIETAVLSIGNEWQGESERAFVAKLLYIRQQFNDLTNFIEDCTNLMETFATQYEEHDKELSSKINFA